MKIATIVGARPQFIKAATISRAIASRKENDVQEILIHTGQHYDANMSDIFFQEMELPTPHYNLGLGSHLHGAMTGRMLEAIEQILIKEKPDFVLVYGDTNSTLAGALAAAKLHIPIAHVEAGLRSFNKKMPEEINRILTDHCSDLLLTPTDGATKQLQKEGIPDHKIVLIGDVMYDAALYYQQKNLQKKSPLENLKIEPSKYVLATIHRAENTDHFKTIESIVKCFSKISSIAPVIWPLHPRTRQTLEKFGLLELASKSITLIDPLGYLDMLMLESQAQMILTDSGGVQKEAYFFKVPCLTFREETEWTELIEHGFNTLVRPDENLILHALKEAQSRKIDWSIPLYGKGDSAIKALNYLIKHK